MLAPARCQPNADPTVAGQPGNAGRGGSGAGRGTPPPSPADVARTAAPRIPLGGLTPGASPPLTSRQLVGFPTWLWLKGWTPRTLIVAGVTVTATPDTATWSLIDATTTCDGPGQVWDPDTDRGDPGRAADCSVTFTHDSHDQPDGLYHGAVAVTWHLTWRATAAGQAGVLPNRTTRVPVTLQVISAQAVTD